MARMVCCKFCNHTRYCRLLTSSAADGSDSSAMKKLAERIRQKAAEIDFSGVVFVQRGDSLLKEAFGCKDRPNQILNRRETRFGIASGTKGFTAVGVAKLIEEKHLEFDTPIASILAGRVQNLHPDITVRHLLGHTSGIGDYLDETSLTNIDEATLPLPPQNLVSPSDYLPLIEKAAAKSLPGKMFSYSNSGYILLALIIELASSQPYQDFIQQTVFDPAGMTATGFFRSDDLPANTATGYLRCNAPCRTNVFHLPIRGTGDGGAYSTAGDMAAFWNAFLEHRLVGNSIVSELTTPRALSPTDDCWYGYGFWLNQDASQIALEGYDPGVSFRSMATRNERPDGYTVLSNTSSGAWPIIRLLEKYFQ